MYKIRDLGLCISFILDNYNYESMNEFNFIFSGDKYSVLPYKKDDFNSLLELLQKDIDQVYLTFRIHLDFRVDFVLSVLFHKNSKTWLGSFWFYNLPSFTCGIFKKLQLFHLMALKNIFSNTKRSSKSFHIQLFSGLRDRSRERGLRRGRGAAWGCPGPDSQKRQNGSDRRSNGQRCILPTPQRRKVQAGTRRPGLISSKKISWF